jgi:hypothetical protein
MMHRPGAGRKKWSEGVATFLEGLAELLSESRLLARRSAAI